MAAPPKIEFDPITGEETKSAAYCKDINKGECLYYEEK